MAGAGGAETTRAQREFMGAEDREGVAVEVEAEIERFGRGRGPRSRRRGGALALDAEAVAAVAGRPAFAGHPVPADPDFDVRFDVVAVEAARHLAGGVADVDLEVFLRLRAGDREADTGIAE